MGFVRVYMPDFDGFITVNEVSKLLGVSIRTLYNWDFSGKLKAGRHPINGYRIYSKQAIEKIRKRYELESGRGV